MFEPLSFLRSVLFAILFAGIEYRYINRREADWTKSVDGFYERPAAWLFSPYQLYLLLPAFVVVAFTLPITTWAGNTFLLALLEDVAYFGWRGKRVMRGEWTTKLFGSVRLAGYEMPVWWPLALMIVLVCYLAPF